MYRRGGGGDESYYDRAVVCRHGHVINSTSGRYPQHDKQFCDQCCAEAIRACSGCGAQIQGKYFVPGVISVRDNYKPPAFCHACGKPFAWTEERQSALSELLEMTAASIEEQAALRNSLPALSAESPGTPVAVAKWKKFLAGAGKQLGDWFQVPPRLDRERGREEAALPVAGADSGAVAVLSTIPRIVSRSGFPPGPRRVGRRPLEHGAHRLGEPDVTPQATPGL